MSPRLSIGIGKKGKMRRAKAPRLHGGCESRPMNKSQMILRVFVCFAIAAITCNAARAQGAGAPAGQANDWLVAFPAHRVVGDIYYVGSAGLGRLT